jgi:hypothetical protein
VVDMSKHAISERLRDVSRQLAERGFASKGVDMSLAAVTMRLRAMAALSTMCLRLGQAKVGGSGEDTRR